jgi:hypothetical protein
MRPDFFFVYSLVCLLIKILIQSQIFQLGIGPARPSATGFSVRESPTERLAPTAPASVRLYLSGTHGQENETNAFSKG